MQLKTHRPNYDPSAIHKPSFLGTQLDTRSCTHRRKQLQISQHEGGGWSLETFIFGHDDLSRLTGN